MIHLVQLYNIAETHPEFSIKWVATSGEIIHVERATCTSTFGKGRTLNIKCIPSGEIRTVNLYSIIEINGEDVVI